MSQFMFALKEALKEELVPQLQSLPSVWMDENQLKPVNCYY